ncbi:MAG: lysylphosphatidylglycerol synthase transmembrane domain-containing protein [Vicinamibacterales bacterium]
MAVKLGLSVGLMAFVLRDTSLDSLWQTFRRVQPLWIAAAMSMHGFMAVSVWRWRLLLDAQHVHVPARTLTESFWVALFFNNFPPSNIGGDVVRIADTSKLARSKTTATMVVLVDRHPGLVRAALGGRGGRHRRPDDRHRHPRHHLDRGGALAALAMCLLLFFAPGLLDLVLSSAARPRPSLGARLEKLQATLTKFRQRPSALAGALLGALLVQGVIVAFYSLTARSLAVPLPLVMAGVLVPVALVLQMVPVSINGFGVREAVFSFFFARFGLSVEAAVAVSLLGTVLIMLFSLGGGALFLLRKH